MTIPASSPAKSRRETAARHSLRGFLLPLLAVMSFLSASALAPAAASAASCAYEYVPAYFYPSGTNYGLWGTAISAAPTNATMIANPSNGPGSSVDSNYVGAIHQAQAAGVQVIGYVYTQWGNRKTSTVERDISHWHTWYGVNGIFFDQAASSAAQLSYYTTLANYARSLGMSVSLNPGTVPDSHYLGIANTIVDFEGDAATYASTSFPSWTLNYGPQFVHIVYNTPAASVAGVLNEAVANNVASVYVTDGTSPNPYGGLPSYWSSLTPFNYPQLCA